MKTTLAWIRGAVVLCTLAVLASCTSAGGSAAGAPAALPPGAAAILGTGTLYLTAGPGLYSANLWRIDLPSGHAVQLTRNKPGYGISNFSASPAGLVMGDAADGTDELDRLWHGKAIPVGDGIGNAPVINNAGQLAYEVDPPGSGAGAYRIVLRNSVTAPPRTIFTESRYGALGTWGWSRDARQILIWESPVNSAFNKTLAITATGQVAWHLTLPGQGADTLFWEPAGLSIGNGMFGHGPNEIRSLSGKVEYSIPGGWEPVCWNPEGTEVIVLRKSNELGLWRLSAPGQVRDLGALPLGDFLECSWLPRPAAGT